jgi:outer membrane protein TolC
VSLADVVGPFFLAQPDEMFAVDRFHPSSAGYRRTAKAMLPTLATVVSSIRDGADPGCDGGSLRPRSLPGRRAPGSTGPAGW